MLIVMLLFSFSIPPKMKIKLTTEVSAPKNTNLNCHQANLLDAVIIALFFRFVNPFCKKSAFFALRHTIYCLSVIKKS